MFAMRYKYIKKGEIVIDTYLNFDNELEIYKDTFNLTDQFIAILDNQMSIKVANKAMLDLIHDEAVNIYDTPYWELPLWSHSIELQNRIMFSIESIYLGEEVKFEATYPDINDNIKNVEVTIKPVYSDDGDIIALVAMGYDTTSAKEAEKKFYTTQKQLATFFEMGVDGFLIGNLEKPVNISTLDPDESFIIAYNEETVVNYNSAVNDILELNAENLCLGSLFKKADVDFDTIKKHWFSMIKNGYVRFMIKFQSKRRHTKYVEFTMVPVIEQNMYSGSYSTIKDITLDKQNEERLFLMANFDYLTGVCNRRYFIDSVNDVLKNNINPMCMVMFDIDHFKSVNDNYGHDTGDIVLRTVSNTINTLLSSDGLFARMGGEEFAAIIYKDMDETIKIIENVLSKIRKLNINVDNSILKTSISAGITKIKPGESFDHFLKRADSALYEAKRNGRDRYSIQ
ncbi:MAG: sensor domain-containing diguanylate cyclase [Peptoanaerobacter stomatis]